MAAALVLAGVNVTAPANSTSIEDILLPGGRFPGSALWWFMWAGIAVAFFSLLYYAKHYEANLRYPRSDERTSMRWALTLPTFDSMGQKARAWSHRVRTALRLRANHANRDEESTGADHAIQLVTAREITSTPSKVSVPRSTCDPAQRQSKYSVASTSACSNTGSCSTAPMSKNTPGNAYNRHRAAAFDAGPRLESAMGQLSELPANKRLHKGQQSERPNPMPPVDEVEDVKLDHCAAKHFRKEVTFDDEGSPWTGGVTKYTVS